MSYMVPNERDKMDAQQETERKSCSLVVPHTFQMEERVPENKLTFASPIPILTARMFLKAVARNKAVKISILTTDTQNIESKSGCRLLYLSACDGSSVEN